MKKYIPKIGEELYLRQLTGLYYVDIVKNPYTVVEVNDNTVKVQSCELIAPVYHCCGNPYLDRPDLEGQRVFFYDTLAESILPDPNGEIIELKWSDKKERWEYKRSKDDSYPQFAVFGKYEYQPYLD